MLSKVKFFPFFLFLGITNSSLVHAAIDDDFSSWESAATNSGVFEVESLNINYNTLSTAKLLDGPELSVPKQLRQLISSLDNAVFHKEYTGLSYNFDINLPTALTPLNDGVVNLKYNPAAAYRGLDSGQRDIKFIFNRGVAKAFAFRLELLSNLSLDVVVTYENGATEQKTIKAIGENFIGISSNQHIKSILIENTGNTGMTDKFTVTDLYTAADIDGDGVSDGRDQCIYTTTGDAVPLSNGLLSKDDDVDDDGCNDLTEDTDLGGLPKVPDALETILLDSQNQLFMDDFNGTALDLYNAAGNPDGQWMRVDEGDSFLASNTISDWKIVSGAVKETTNIYWKAATGTTENTISEVLGSSLLSRTQDISVPGNASLQWQNYVVSAKVKSGDDDGVGFVFRVQVESPVSNEDGVSAPVQDYNYYRFVWNSNYDASQTHYRRLIKKITADDGTGNVVNVFTKLAGHNTQAPTYATDYWYQFHIVAEGERLSIYLDGQLILTANDPDLAQGAMGLFVIGNDSSHFDDVKVIQLIDDDNDGVIVGDNCPNVANEDQADSNNNNIGDACEKAIWFEPVSEFMLN